MQKKRGRGAMKFGKEGVGEGQQTEKKEGAGGSNFQGGGLPPFTFLME